MRATLISACCAHWLLTSGVCLAAEPSPASPDANAVLANDNRRPAGSLDEGVLTIKLVASQREWQPEGGGGRTLSVQVFGEESRTPSVPGPLIRVPAGSEVRASIRNDIAGTTLSVFGLGERPAASASTPLRVPAGETREVRFAAPPPGTYHYWATTANRSLRERFDVEGPLGGAFIVDPPGAPITDRVFVIGLWRKPGTGPGTGQKPIELGTINGRSWPATETLEHRVGDVIRWRVVNLSFDMHAMHLHGNYFSVVSTGDGTSSRTYAPEDRQQVVTEHMDRGETMEMQWTPARPGNWLFHCHMVLHMTPLPDAGGATVRHHAEDPSAGMAGLVLGIRVTGDAAPATQASSEPRRFTLRLREEPGRYGTQAGYRVDVEGLESTRLGAGAVPAPLIALTRGEPVEVALVNEMSERTAIHWHGIELDSYFDGVPGWGGSVGNVTPAIEPGRTFRARFTPSRAGTFIYHTHWHDEAQLVGGLYGALIVLEPGQRFDPAADHVFIVGYDGPTVIGQPRTTVLNGSRLPVAAPGPVPTPLRADAANRLRLINITPNNPALIFALTDGFKPVAWTPIGKDGADLPASWRASREARQLVSVGETYDFEITPSAAQRLWLEVRSFSGEWVAQALLVAAP